MAIGDINLSLKPRDLELYLAKPNKTIVGKLSEAYNKILISKLSAINELKFAIPLKIERNHELIDNPNISKIKERYLIKAKLGNDVEWYKIIKINKIQEEENDYYQVICFSLGYELSDKRIKNYSVTSYNAQQVLTDCLNETNWNIDYIDPEFNLKYRSFEIQSKKRLDFLFEIAKTFDGIIVFDTENRKINLYKKDNIGINRGLKISYGHYLKTLNNESDSDKVVTRLKVYGKDGLSIETVNPRGTNYIDDFSYFKSEDYMGSDLITAIDNYNTLLKSKEPIQDVAEDGTTTTNIVMPGHGLVDGDYIVNQTRGREIRKVTVVDIDNITVSAVDGQSSGDTILKYSDGTFGKLLFQKQDLQEQLIRQQNELQTLEDEKTIILDNIIIQTENETITNYNFIYNGVTETKTTNLDSSYKYAVMCKVSDTTDLTVKLDGVIKTLQNDTWAVLGKIADSTSTSVEISGTATNVNVSIIIVKITDIEYTTSDNDEDILNNYNLNYKENQISVKEAEINQTNINIDSIDNDIAALRNEIDMNNPNNFTFAQLEELNQFIIEDEWIDENYTDAWNLYNDALEKLQEINTPPINLTVDIVNFLEIIEEQRNWDKLVLGDYVIIKHEQLNINIQAQIIEIEYNFEEGDINLTISNLKDIDNDEEKFIKSIYKTINTATEFKNKKINWDEVALNFNNRNDRDATPVANPIIPSGGVAIDHTQNDDGSVNISFEWDYEDSSAIDGFLVYLYSTNNNNGYTFGSTIAKEQIFTVKADKRAIVFYGVPANQYYSFGVQAYRVVDEDINNEGIIKSDIIQPSLSSENPYLPSANVAFKGDVQGTIGGTPYDEINKTPATVVVADRDTTRNYKQADYVVPSGSINAEIIINNAINSLPDSGGKVVLLEGIYNISDDIVIPSNITLEGQGDSTIIQINNSYSSILNSDTINGNNNIILQNFLLEGNNIEGYAIGFDNVNDSKIIDLKIRNYTGSGIYIVGNNNTVNKCYIENVSKGIWVDDPSVKNVISNNIIIDAVNAGIRIEGVDGNTNHNVISSNYCESGNDGGIYLFETDNNNVVGNVCKNNQNAGIYVYNSKYNTISSNTFNNNGKIGILVYATSHYNIISNNNCQRNGRQGIILAFASNNNNIIGNYCSENSQEIDNTYDNIFIDISSSYNNIQNNICRQGNLTNKPRYGININESWCEGNIVVNNDIYISGKTGNFNDAGTGTITTAGNRL